MFVSCQEGKSHVMQRLSRSLSRLETQDIKTQPQINHYLIKSYLSAKHADVKDYERK